MSENYIRLPDEGVGKRLRAISQSISGNDTYMEVLVLADQSGNIITPSNQLPIQLSGQGVFLPATQVVKVSGEFVEIVSGQTIQLPATQIVQISGQGVILPATQVVKISGEAVTLLATQQVQISGQGVFLPATQVVKVSGDTVVIASGAIISRGLLSGLQVIIGSISGQGAILPATQVVKTSGEASQPTRYLPVTASGSPTISSGDVAWILVDVDGRVRTHITSGEVTLPSTQIVKISGDTVQLQSGTIVQLPATQSVQISGQGAFLPSTQVVKISGETVQLLPSTDGLSRPLLQVTGASGGAILTSGVVEAISIKALTGNTGDIFVGFGTATNMPYSGFGYILDAGDTWDLDVDNMGRVRVFATSSGDLVSYGGLVK